MTKPRVCVVGGWCGNRMALVAEHLDHLLDSAGYPCKVSAYSAWENYSTPPSSDLILQLVPAYTNFETGCPVLNIKPLLADLNHPETIAMIIDQIRQLYQNTEMAA